MEKAETLLYNWEAIITFLPYLNISDLLKSSLISKTWLYNINQYIKRMLIPQEYIHVHPNPIKALKILYNRKIFIMENNDIKKLKFPYLMQKLSVGNFVTCITSLTGESYLTSNLNLQILNKNQLAVSPSFKKMSHKYSDIKCIGDYVYCIKNSDLIQYKPTVDNILADERLIEFDGTIDYFIPSFAFCFICCAELTNQPRYYIFSHKNPNPQRIQLKLPLNNIQKSITMGHDSNALIISTEGTVYQGNLQHVPLQLNPLKMLKGKRISEIKSGKGHFFAFQMKKKPINEWNTQDVILWADQNGFSDYNKIFKSQNVTGKKLVTMDKLYMEDYLGITGTKTQQKMKLLIEQCQSMHLRQQNYNVYAWGRNDKGQIGLNPSKNSNNVIKPKLPQDFYIWQCLGDYTVLKKINSEVYLVNKIVENKLQWQQISQSRIWSIGCMKGGKLIFCASLSKEKTPQRLSELPIEHEKRKIKTARNIIDKIMWDENLNKQDFKVGYMDRYNGMLETDLQEFMKGEIKEYRIYYFKEKGKLVWDRSSRLDIL